MGVEFTRFVVSVCIVTLAVGCQSSRPPNSIESPSLTVPSGGIEQAPTREPIRWDFSATSTFRIPIGDKLLTATPDTKGIQAVDASGAIRWTAAVPGVTSNIVVRSDLTEGLVPTTSGYVWLDLTSGEVLGVGPVQEPVAREFMWHGDWLLVGEPRFQSPVNPQAPGKSKEFTTWTLYRANRTESKWESIGQLSDMGQGLATMSANGKVVVVGVKESPEFLVYIEGRLARRISMSEHNSFVMITPSGKFLVERTRGSFAIYDITGTLIVNRSFPGTGVSVWGDRIVVSDGSNFSVYDTQGHELFGQSGTVPRQQVNDRYLVVGDGTSSRLVDHTGKVRITLPSAIGSTMLAADGRWAYHVAKDFVRAFPIPD